MKYQRFFKLIAAVSIFASSGALADKGVGSSGGGTAFIKRDPVTKKIEQVLFYDFEELTRLDSLSVNLGDTAGKNYREIAQNVIDRFAAIAPYRAQSFSDWLNKFESDSERRWIEGSEVDLELPGSEQEYKLNLKGWERSVVVGQYTPGHDEKRYAIIREIWDAAPETIKAGITIHEWARWTTLSQGVRDPRAAIRFTKALVSRASLTESAFNKIMSDSDFFKGQGAWAEKNGFILDATSIRTATDGTISSGIPMEGLVTIRFPGQLNPMMASKPVLRFQGFQTTIEFLPFHPAEYQIGSYKINLFDYSGVSGNIVKTEESGTAIWVRPMAIDPVELENRGRNFKIEFSDDGSIQKITPKKVYTLGEANVVLSCRLEVQFEKEPDSRSIFSASVMKTNDQPISAESTLYWGESARRVARYTAFGISADYLKKHKDTVNFWYYFSQPNEELQVTWFTISCENASGKSRQLFQFKAGYTIDSWYMGRHAFDQEALSDLLGTSK